MIYNWQQSDWPHFHYNAEATNDLLFTFAELTGKLSGVLLGLSEQDRSEAELHFMASEAIKTSQIEGELLDREDVMSSIRNQLGLNTTSEMVRDGRALAITQVLLDVRKTYQETLNQQMLFRWHAFLFEGTHNDRAGKWRTHSEPMQVVSGPIGRPTVHFEAPPSKHVPGEMRRFMEWFNTSAPPMGGDLPSAALRASIAHLYFETLHPFEDGNGRIGRAIAEKALFQGLGRTTILSMSSTIEARKQDYYNALKTAQRSNEITSWILHFVQTLIDGQKEAQKQIEFTLKKAHFFDRLQEKLNARQQKALSRMMKEGPKGFAGGLTAQKYCAITKCSKATATRDLGQLEAFGALQQIGSGRNTRYELVL